MKLFCRIIIVTGMLLCISGGAMHAAEQQQMQEEISLETSSAQQLSVLATLAYEQYFFLETLLACLSNERFEDFRNDIVDAYTAISSSAKKVARKSRFSFDGTMTIEEKCSVTVLYSALLYLAGRSTLSRIVADLPQYKHERHLQPLCSVVEVLSSFAFDSAIENGQAISSLCKRVRENLEKAVLDYCHSLKPFHFYYLKF